MLNNIHPHQFDIQNKLCITIRINIWTNQVWWSEGNMLSTQEESIPIPRHVSNEIHKILRDLGSKSFPILSVPGINSLKEQFDVWHIWWKSLGNIWIIIWNQIQKYSYSALSVCTNNSIFKAIAMHDNKNNFEILCDIAVHCGFAYVFSLEHIQSYITGNIFWTRRYMM